MLDYTKTALKQAIDDFKKAFFVLKVATQIVYIAYLIYALISMSGLWVVNGILLALSLGYFFFFLFATAWGRSPDGKKMTKRVTAFYVWSKRLVQLFNLGVAIYGLCYTATNVNVFAVLMSALMIVGWVLNLVFEIVQKFVGAKIGLVIAGLEADIENVTKPVRTVGNFFKKMTGKEIEPEKEKSKARVYLEK
ncbi:MAG: hypothetical protein IJ506_07965, partial [Clostridia bacterium]|nr:hypothetical protein [Clostridia bacterium]